MKKEYISCPAHEDTNPSCLYTEYDGRKSWRCFAGCSGEAIAMALGLVSTEEAKVFCADNYCSVGKAVIRANSDQKINTATLAAHKRLPEEVLVEYGVEDTENGVVINYRKEDGSNVAKRYRYGLSGRDVRTKPGSKSFLYGLWQISFFRCMCDIKKKGLFLVEGESDCWTLWHQGFLGYGVPGCQLVSKVLELQHVAFSPEIYIWCEPDKGGRAFVENCVQRLREIKYAGKIRVLQHDRYKDASDWYQHDNEFRKHFTEALASASDPDEFLSVPEALTEFRMSEKVAAKIGDEFRFVPEIDKWMHYKDGIWREDNGKIRLLRIVEVIRTIKQEITESIKSRELREATIKTLNKFESINSLSAICQGASLLLKEPLSKWDNDPYAFHCSNGVMNLKTGEFLPHDPGQLLTQTSGVTYDADAKCPKIEKFLSEIMLGDKELVDYLISYIGKSMTAIPEKVLLLLYGAEGSNGKTAFINLVRMLLGDYAKTIDASTLMRSKSKSSGSSPREDIYRLRAARAVFTEEVSSKMLDEQTVKNLTGNGMVVARTTFGKCTIEFPQTWKLWMEGNNQPSINEEEDAIWNRIQSIEFNAVFAKNDPTTIPMEELLAGFRTELSGLLNLALAALRQNKVETPESVKRASQHYRDSNSILKAFVEECVVRQSGARTHAAIMYSFYRNWCERNGHQAMASRRFGALISKRFGFEKLPDKRHWEGVAMLCPRGEDTTTYKPDVF